MTKAPPAPLSVASALERRVSVRAFLDRPVPREIIERIVRQAARAPSGGNLQPWHVRIIDGSDMAAFKALMDQRIREAPDSEPMPAPFYPDPLTSAQLRRRQRNGEILYAALGIDRTDMAARRAWNALNFRFFGAPSGVFLFLDRNATPFQWLDLGIYLQSLLLLLAENGLEACPQADWAMYGETVSGALGVDQALMLVCGVAIGHADPAHPENHIRTERDDPLAQERNG
ncbi:nitroreductase [Arsenicitalea aurantiaca]|uniref:nitroreductase n=1 Tax=Arsenicitalea aurantiaca TaxID=1783274 RepID=UPI00195B57DA|nr:nitroreductase [Arsenicitalea aurantiaca]